MNEATPNFDAGRGTPGRVDPTALPVAHAARMLNAGDNDLKPFAYSPTGRTGFVGPVSQRFHRANRSCADVATPTELRLAQGPLHPCGRQPRPVPRSIRSRQQGGQPWALGLNRFRLRW